MRLAIPFGLLLVAGCVSPIQRGRLAWADGLSHRGEDPIHAGYDFAEADYYLAKALADDDLEPAERVEATSRRIRALLELERHGEALNLSRSAPAGFDPSADYPGDVIGLALLSAWSRPPERGFATLIAAERRASTPLARLHLAWQQVHLLRAWDTPKARDEARRICEAHQGQLDFDSLKP